MSLADLIAAAQAELEQLLTADGHHGDATETRDIANVLEEATP